MYMMTNAQLPPSSLMHLKLEDYGVLQARYQAMKLADRAAAMLLDAEPALKAVDRIITLLEDHPSCAKAFEALRKNHVITGKMRPSDAKQLLMDGANDFTKACGHKLAAWRKTLERLASGEGISQRNGKEVINADSSLAMAIIGTMGISAYFSILQLAIGELTKLDAKNVREYQTMLAETRRCSTILSDCENASGITTVIH